MRPSIVPAALVFALAAPALAQPLSTAFTYQGQLANNGQPASGVFDLEFRLYDAAVGGAPVGPTLCADNLTITGGHFTLQLDFGPQFSTQSRHIEARVRQDTGLTCANTSGFTTLAPRQPITAAPVSSFSLVSASATDATNLNGQPAAFYTNASNLSSGSLPDARLSGNIPRLDQPNTFTNITRFEQFTGVHRTTPLTGAEVFGLQNPPGQPGYTGMYINSTDGAGGLPFYGYSVGGRYAWTFLDPAGTWRLFNNGAALTALSNGNVGVGTDNPSTRLHVAGAATASDFNFSAPQTSFLMVPATAFDARDNAPVSREPGGASFPTTTDNTLYAPVMLPHGATITAVRCYVYDNGPDRLAFVLFRSQTNGFTYAQANGNTAGPSAGMQTVAMTNLAIAVDNTQFAFTLAAIPHSSWAGPLHAVRFVSIEYTLPRPAR